MSELVIPPAEFKERTRKVRRLMAQRGVDALFIYTDELHMADGFYLSSYWPIIEPGAVLVPLEGELFLLGGPEAGPYAQEVSVIENHRAVDAFIVPEEEYPGAVIVPLPDVFAEAMGGRPLRKLGIVGYDVMPHGLWEAIGHAFPGVAAVDVTRDFEVMRAVKSEAEIAIMKRTFDLGAEGLKAGIPFIRPGAVEFEVVGAAEGRMRSLGLDGFNFRSLAAAGPRSNGVVPPASARIMQSGELLLFGFGPRYRGYSAGTSGTFPVNYPPTKEQTRFLGDLADALEATRDALRPGLTGKQIDAVPRNFLTERGYGPYLSQGIVHTVGLKEYERPFFGPNSEDVLEPGLTVCTDITVFGHPTFFGSRLETGYVVREDGPEPLSQAMDDLLLSLRDPQGLWSQYRR